MSHDQLEGCSTLKGRIGRMSFRLKTPFQTALRRVETIEELVLQLTCEESGLTVHTGCSPVTPVTGETFSSVIDVWQGFLQNPSRLWLAQNVTSNPTAISALDVGLHRLKAARKQQSLYTYLHQQKTSLYQEDPCKQGLSEVCAPAVAPTPLELGLSNASIEPSTISTCFTLSLQDPEAMARQAESAVRDGFRSLKVKLGGKQSERLDRARLIEVVAAARSVERSSAPSVEGATAGKGQVTYRLDANQSWSATKTLALLEDWSAVFDISQIEMIEQPVRKDDLPGLKTLATDCPVDIYADESFMRMEQLNSLAQEVGLQGVVVKLGKLGSVRSTLQSLERARKLGLKTMLGCMADGPLAAHAQLVIASLASPDLVDLDPPFLLHETDATWGVQLCAPELCLLADHDETLPLPTHWNVAWSSPVT